MTIAITRTQATTACVEHCQELLAARGLATWIVETNGKGGLALEAALRAGKISGVLDVTLCELADHLCGGIQSAGPDRMTAAAVVGIPQVICLGGLDMVRVIEKPLTPVPSPLSTGARGELSEPVPSPLSAGARGELSEPVASPPRTGARGTNVDRRIIPCADSEIALIRTNLSENDRLGNDIAQKASAARGLTVILIPLRGLSAHDRDGQTFWWPSADNTLFQSLRNWLSPHVPCVEVDCHINDAAFARRAVDTLLSMLQIS